MSSVKKTFALIGILLVSFAVSSEARAATTFRPPGDLNGDLRVTINDAIIVLKMIAGLQSFTADDITIGDVAPAVGTGGRTWGDGRLTAADAIRLLRRAVGLEPDPWPGGTAFAVSSHQFKQEVTQASAPYQWSLSDGVIFTGALTDASGNPSQAKLAFWNAAKYLVGYAEPDARGAFSFACPAGLYQVSAVRRDTAKDGNYVDLPSDLGNLQVQSGMSSATFQLPASPTVYAVKFGLNSLPQNYIPAYVEFLDLNHQYDASPPPTEAVVPYPFVNYSARLPSGSYKVIARLSRIDKKGTVDIIPSQSVSVGGDRTVSINVTYAIATLSGSLSISGDNRLQTGSITMTATLKNRNGSGGTGIIANGAYFSPMQSGVSYVANFYPDSLNPATDSGYHLSYELSDISATGNNTRNILLPSPPTTNPISVWIGDDLGRPIPNATIHLLSDRLYNVDPNYVQEATTKTDSQGAATLSIPDGVYEISLGPWESLPSVSLWQN